MFFFVVMEIASDRGFGVEKIGAQALPGKGEGSDYYLREDNSSLNHGTICFYNGTIERHCLWPGKMGSPVL